MRKIRFLSIILLSLAAFCFGAAAQTTGKLPVIIIPGISGSQLVNPETGKTVWFSVTRDKGDDLRLPMTSPVLSRNTDTLVARDIIREIEIPVLPDIEVYKTLIEALKQRGYAEGDWSDPKASDVFYVFPYDWRRDNVETARLLIGKMTAAKRSLKNPKLKFDILAHSMGGLIARYAAMYGSADLPRGSSAPVLTWAGAKHINKLMMFGTPNEGSFGSFDAILNGYPIIAGRNLPFIDDFRPGDVITNPSIFQLMPHRSTARFLDENLQPLEVDIYNVETWIKYGWGALSDPKFLSKLKDAEALAVTNKDIKPESPGKDANIDDLTLARTTYAQVRAYLSSVLDRTRRFHQALDVKAKRLPIQQYAFGGNCEQTLDAVVLIRDDKKNRWTTLVDAKDIKTSGGKEIKKEEVKAAMFAIGDGRVTQRSLLAESNVPDVGGTQLTSRPLAAPFLVCSSHFKLFLEKPIQDSFLSALIVEKTDQP